MELFLCGGQFCIGCHICRQLGIFSDRVREAMLRHRHILNVCGCALLVPLFLYCIFGVDTLLAILALLKGFFILICAIVIIQD